MTETRRDGDTIEIVRLGGEGDGVAEGPDGAVFVPRAVPGERVASDADGSWRVVGRKSVSRRETVLCPHFPACGGCTVQHLGEDLYRSWKADLLTTAFARQGLSAAIEPMVSVPIGSRRRATLTGRHTATGFVFGFHGPKSHDIVPITQCAVLAPAIVSALGLLRDIAMRAAPRPDGEARVSVLVAREGLDVTVSAGRRAERLLFADLARIVATAPIARVTLNGEPAVQRATPTIGLSGVDVAPPPAAFLQAVAEAEAAITTVILETLPKKTKHVADLFAGLGTFSFALAGRAQVQAYDSDRILIEALAQAARGASGLKPIATTVRDLFRDPLSPNELARFDAVVFDPPRAGAKGQAEAIARSKVRRVVAVSCNPATLARDVAILVAGGLAIERVVPIDQFLYTPHLEAVVILGR